MDIILVILPLLIGWSLDLIFGDPEKLPHPIVGFGKAVAWIERIANKGKNRKMKGALSAIMLIVATYVISAAILSKITYTPLNIAVQSVLIFYCLAGTTLIREVRGVFRAVDISLAKGRVQVGRIVGRDTTSLSAQEIRTAALETLAENLSDGVVAPLFWYLIGGVPGILAYKMVNTLDSMIGYRNERYKAFGFMAAKIDDVANYIPARITSVLMVMSMWRPKILTFVKEYGPKHLSPNSGYPEAALAGILDCRFGGPHDYFGEEVYKPYIGTRDRLLDSEDMKTAVSVNRRVECIVVVLIIVIKVSMVMPNYFLS